MGNTLEELLEECLEKFGHENVTWEVCYRRFPRVKWAYSILRGVSSWRFRDVKGGFKGIPGVSESFQRISTRSRGVLRDFRSVPGGIQGHYRGFLGM